MQSTKLRDLDTRIAADEKRQRDLQAIKAQVDEFQQKKAMLENKVLVIEQLRLAQKSPVHMLDEISKALPDFVWLTGLDENRGGLRFNGQSNSLTAVADFISALQRSGWFPQVDLGTSQQAGNLVNFTLTGTFKDPEVAAKEKAAAEAEAAAAHAPARPPAAGRGREAEMAENPLTKLPLAGQLGVSAVVAAAHLRRLLLLLVLGCPRDAEEAGGPARRAAEADPGPRGHGEQAARSSSARCRRSRRGSRPSSGSCRRRRRCPT